MLVMERAISDSRSQKKRVLRRYLQKGGSIIHPFSKAQYPTAPGVKNLDTPVEAWHATTFRNENTGFQRKLLERKASF